jgi:hypothetical protein
VLSPVEPPIVWLLEEFQAMRLTKDWQAMRALLHASSRLESLAAPGLVLSADGLIEAIRGATEHGIYAVKSWQVEPLGQRAGLVDGRVRYRYGRRGFTDEHRVWVSTERDGLIWRMRVFHDRRSSLRCFGEGSLDLGL